jgi:hypothetical protein
MQSQVKIPHLKAPLHLKVAMPQSEHLESAKRRTNEWRQRMNEAGFKYRGFWVSDEEYTRIKKMLKKEKAAKGSSSLGKSDKNESAGQPKH